MRRSAFYGLFGFVTFFAACSSAPQQQAESKPPREQAAQQPAQQPLTPEAAPAPRTRGAQAKPLRAATNERPASAPRKGPRSLPQETSGSTPAPPAIPARAEPVYTPPVAVRADGQSQPGSASDGSFPAKSNRAAAPEPPPPVYATVPAGTKIAIRLVDALDSAVAQADDTFHGTLDDDLVVEGRTVLPRGSEVTGKVVTAGASGRVKGRANLSIALTEIRTGNSSYPIRTNTLSFEAEGTQKQDAVKVGGGASLGAIIGAIAGGGKGAAIGAAVGGAAGTAGVLATKGKEVKFSREDRLAFSLREDFEIRLR